MSFEFIIVFLINIYRYLSQLAGITVKLQGKAVEIVDANEMIAEIDSVYKEERNVESNLHHIYKQCLVMAEKVGSSAEMPRIASRQQH